MQPFITDYLSREAFASLRAVVNIIRISVEAIRRHVSDIPLRRSVMLPEAFFSRGGTDPLCISIYLLFDEIAVYKFLCRAARSSTESG